MVLGQNTDVYTVELASPGTFSSASVPEDVTRLKFVGKMDLPTDCIELYKLLMKRRLDELDFKDASFEKCDSAVKFPYYGHPYSGYVSCYQDNSFPVGMFSQLDFPGKIIMPSTLKSIKAATFYEALSQGSEVVFSEGLDTLEQDAFCFSGLTKVKLPESLKYIGSGCFYDNMCLKELYLPDNIEEVDDSLFANCYDLEHVHLPKALKRIQWWSMSGKFKTLTIPAGVEYVGCESLNFCYGLEELHCLPVVPPECGHESSRYIEGRYTGNTFREDVVDKVVLYVPKGSLDAYKSADEWKRFKDIREEADDYEEDLSWYNGGDTSISGVRYSNPDSESTDVYTLQGVRVKHDVKRGDWASGLVRGIYIVGGKKAVVK